MCVSVLGEGVIKKLLNRDADLHTFHIFVNKMLSISFNKAFPSIFNLSVHTLVC